MSSLLGGNSKQSSSSSSFNQAYPYLQGALSGTVSNGTGATDLVSQLLGASPMTDAASNGLNNFLGSSGFNFAQQQGQNSINNNAAAHGLLNSGSTAKALTTFGQNLGQQSFGNYLSQLMGLGQQGLSAANVIGGAGSTSNSNSSGKSKQGLGL